MLKWNDLFAVPGIYFLFYFSTLVKYPVDSWLSSKLSFCMETSLTIQSSFLLLCHPLYITLKTTNCDYLFTCPSLLIDCEYPSSSLFPHHWNRVGRLWLNTLFSSSLSMWQIFLERLLYATHCSRHLWIQYWRKPINPLPSWTLHSCMKIK